ncbi:DUF262 domain-containing protein [Thermococcus sp. JCM 11816]|uniref:DUF262 domain-containing protein n=1 Tax=Thermococcus sp. (strain JCM 11816 / KS-1) TaxID=1295125 RepID=UPI0006D106F0
MDKLDPKMENLLEILKQAEEGKLVLPPQFQRDFVWSKQNIKDLLVSLLNGYFIGTFLFLRTDPTNPPIHVEANPRCYSTS